MYVPGKHQHVANALSCDSITYEADCVFIDDFEVMVHSVTQTFPGSSERLEQTRCASAEDATLQRLYQVVMKGLARITKVHTRICETIIVLEHAR